MNRLDLAKFALALAGGIGGPLLTRIGGRAYELGLSIFMASTILYYWSIKNYFDRIEGKQRRWRFYKIVEFIRVFFGFFVEGQMLRHRYSKEVRNEAAIVTTIGVVVAFLESIQSFIAPHGQWWEIAARIISIAVIGLFLFAVVYYFAGRLEAIQMSQRLPLARIGEIDGFYIDAVWEPNWDCWELRGRTFQPKATADPDKLWNLIGGSILHIDSQGTERMHFNINGDFYELGNSHGSTTLARSGDWSGRGYTYGEDGFVYDYKGGEGPWRHHGFGYYDFHRHPADDGLVTFSGSFSPDASISIRRVNGLKIRREEQDRFKQDGGVSLLTDFVSKIWATLNPPTKAQNHDELAGGDAKEPGRSQK